MPGFPNSDQAWPQTVRVTPWCDITKPPTFAEGAPASLAWNAANQARFIPFIVARPVTVTSILVLNGPTINGNLDVGIYDMAGNRLVSIGATAHSGASAIQTFNITDTLLAPGRYYVALASDSATATFYAWTSTDFSAPTDLDYLSTMVGVKSQATAYVLPATATYAALDQDIVPVIALVLV